ncbi:Mitochondrial phosphate carrier protein [Grifola frondosa]|uniref:Mitochondrial phosphate carrier protein n=1 Tax=Grifola frondosa TaxID=5627 RepID=A0A1C7M9L6_GRIFR|nr:Mitochondrial phosphate carrier protein [Grifola frondosa]
MWIPEQPTNLQQHRSRHTYQPYRPHRPYKQLITPSQKPRAQHAPHFLPHTPPIHPRTSFGHSSPFIRRPSDADLPMAHSEVQPRVSPPHFSSIGADRHQDGGASEESPPPLTWRTAAADAIAGIHYTLEAFPSSPYILRGPPFSREPVDVEAGERIVLIEEVGEHAVRVRVVRTGMVGLVPAWNVEGALERLARINMAFNEATTCPAESRVRARRRSESDVERLDIAHVHARCLPTAARFHINNGSSSSSDDESEDEYDADPHVPPRRRTEPAVFEAEPTMMEVAAPVRPSKSVVFKESARRVVFRYPSEALVDAYCGPDEEGEEEGDDEWWWQGWEEQHGDENAEAYEFDVGMDAKAKRQSREVSDVELEVTAEFLSGLRKASATSKEPFVVPQFTSKDYSSFFLAGAQRRTFIPLNAADRCFYACLQEHYVAPIDVVKTRIQIDPALARHSLLSGTRYIVAQEGPAALLTGFGPTAVGYLAQGGAKFAGYEFWKKQFVQIAGDQEAAVAHRTAIYLGASSVAEFFADILLTPLEATRIRLVSQRHYASGLLSGFARLAREEGVRGLYAGFLPILCKQIPYAIGQFTVNEFCHELAFRNMSEETRRTLTPGSKFGISLGSGIIAGFAAAILTGGTLLSQINKGHGPQGSMAYRLRVLAQQAGVRGLFVGLGPRMVMTAGLVSGQFLLYGAIKDERDHGVRGAVVRARDHLTYASSLFLVVSSGCDLRRLQTRKCHARVSHHVIASIVFVVAPQLLATRSFEHSSLMPRPKAAQTWVPNAEEQRTIDKIADYALIAERCLAHVRTVDPLIAEPLWIAIKAEWAKDPAKYPSVIGPLPNETDKATWKKFGGKSFSTKVEEICRKEPHTTSDYINAYFAVTSGLQGISRLELWQHPFSGEFYYRANLIVQKADQAAVNAILEQENKAQTPLRMEYTVVDCGSSARKGQWVTIQEGSSGPQRDISVDEMVDMLKRRIE